MTERSYSGLIELDDFFERFRYLALYGVVAQETFGTDRWLNQAFYRSREWKLVRNHVIARDEGCDLGVKGHEIHSKLLIHHMNPMTADDIKHGNETILEPEFLVTTHLLTHNAIHYGDESLLPRSFIERRPGDTRPWGNRKDNHAHSTSGYRRR